MSESQETYRESIKMEEDEEKMEEESGYLQKYVPKFACFTCSQFFVPVIRRAITCT